MNPESDSTAQKVIRLEGQMLRLRTATYLIWPAVWIATICFAFVPSRLDEKAMRVFLQWVQEGFFGVMIVLFMVLALGFLLKVAADFSNRRSRFVLNPGSKR